MAACAALEKAINTALSLDIATKTKLQTYHGKILKLSCTRPNLSVHIVLGTPCVVSHHCEDHIDAAISGDISSWLELISATDKASALVNSALSITGDSRLLIELGQIAVDVEIDWEGHLASFVGDVPAHFAGKAASEGLAFSSRLQQTLRRTVDDFIHEEAQLLPSRIETDNLYQALRDLEIRIERLHALADALTNRMPVSSSEKNKSANDKTSDDQGSSNV